jgi:hypothetical protein
MNLIRGLVLINSFGWPVGCGNAFLQLTRRSTPAAAANLPDCGHDHLGT